METVSWITPPECGGQAVEISYATCEAGVLRRIHDRSVGEITYDLAAWEDVQGEAQPWDESPRASRWVEVTAAQVAALIDE